MLNTHTVVQVDGMDAFKLAKRANKSEVVALLEAAAIDRRKANGEERRGIWSGKLGASQ